MYFLPSISESSRLLLHELTSFLVFPISDFGFLFLWSAKTVSLVHLFWSLLTYLWLHQHCWKAFLSTRDNRDVVVFIEKESNIGKCASEVVVDCCSNSPKESSYLRHCVALSHIELANVRQVEASALGFTLWLLGNLSPPREESMAKLLHGERSHGEKPNHSSRTQTCHTSYQLTANEWTHLIPTVDPPTWA